MTNTITPTTAKVYFLTTGEVRDSYGETTFHPLSNVNMIEVYVEDGDESNVVTINYNPSIRKKWATHWFPCFYRGLVEHTLDGESDPRTFAQYITFMPAILASMNQNSTTPMAVTATLQQQAGTNLIGSYATVASLPTSYGDWEDLQDLNEADAVAYVYEAGVNGFYMVEFDDPDYAWTLQTTTIQNEVYSKQYDVWNISIQAGYGNPAQQTDLTDEQYRLIWQEFSELAALIASNESEIDDIISGTQVVGKAVADQNNETIHETYQRLDNLVTEFQTTPDDTHYPSEKLVDDTVDNVLAGTTKFTKITLTDGSGNDFELTFNGVDAIGAFRGVSGEFFKNLFVEFTAQSTISNGDPIMYAGSPGASGIVYAVTIASGNNVTVFGQTLDALVAIKLYPFLFLGLATMNVTNGQNGLANWYGSVNDLNTSTYTLGKAIYVDPINGGLTETKPTEPNPAIIVGVTTRVHATVGAISVKPIPTHALNAAYDVYTNGGQTDGDVLKWVAANSRYELDDRVTALVTANMIKSVSWNGTTFYLTFTHYDDTTSSVNITLAQLKTFIGEATSSLSGLLSATDKTRLDTLYALLNDTTDGSADSVVDNISEVLAIFDAYPEGADLVTALAGKVDKVTGYSLVDDDEIAHLIALDTQAELDAKFALKVPKTTTIAEVDLQNNITAEELKIALSLDEVDNTADIDKPISTATQTALDLKAAETETRSIGAETITYRDDGKVSQVVADTVTTTPTYDEYGNITKITEVYALDGKTYETTFTYDKFGRISATNKVEV
jgi:hypothetical protein